MKAIHPQAWTPLSMACTQPSLSAIFSTVMIVSVKDMIEFFRRFAEITADSGAQLAYGTRTTIVRDHPGSLTADVSVDGVMSQSNGARFVNRTR